MRAARNTGRSRPIPARASPVPVTQCWSASRRAALRSEGCRSIAPFHKWDRNFFLLWVLLTVQVQLIRSHRVDIHRKLGVASMVLAGVMVILDTATAVIVNRVLFGEAGRDPAFLGVEFTDMTAFAGLAGAAFLLTKQPAPSLDRAAVGRAELGPSSRNGHVRREVPPCPLLVHP